MCPKPLLIGCMLLKNLYHFFRLTKNKFLYFLRKRYKQLHNSIVDKRMHIRAEMLRCREISKLLFKYTVDTVLKISCNEQK